MKTNTTMREIIEKVDEIAQLSSKVERPGGLLTGAAGELLFQYYYKKYKGEDLNEISELVEEVVSAVTEADTTNYVEGLAGYGWLISFLQEEGILDLDDQEFWSELDSALAAQMQQHMQIGNYDFFYGATSLGIHFVQRRNSEQVNILLDHLLDTAIKTEKGYNWLHVIYEQDGTPKSVTNVSVAHGSSAMVYFLSECIAKRVGDQQKAHELFNAAVDYILSHERENEQYRFPGSIIMEEGPEYGTVNDVERLAWCYGDVGIAITMMNAGRKTDRFDIYQRGEDILMATVSIQDHQEAGIQDAGMCHGTAGLVQMYRRAYRLSGKEEFLKASNYWLEATLEYATFEDGYAGFKSCGHDCYEKEVGILEGVNGIGLSMLGSLDENANAWEKVLLLA